MASSETLSAGVTIRRLQAAGLTSGAALRRARPVTFAAWPLFNPLAGYANFVVPAVFILILQQTILIGLATMRVAERHQPRPSPEPFWAVLAGKVGAVTLVYIGHAAFMFGVVFKLYSFPMRGEWWSVGLFLAPYFAATTLLGLAMAELFDRPESSTVAFAAISLPALFLSGMSFPSECQAGWVRSLAQAFPSTFGIRGFLQLGEMGARFGQTLHAWGALWVQVLVYGTLAWTILRLRDSAAAR
jgi:ABC-2 type transport system permease protein